MAMLIISLILIAGCGSDKKEGGVAGETAGGADLVQKGDPVLAAAEGYVGSEVCGTCHGVIFTGWSKSLHNKPLKTVAELGSSIFVNDTDENGANDFVDGFDFNDPDFQTTHGYSNPFSAMTPTWAPVLSASGGNYYITIGDTQYEVQRTQGGNGYWKQRYQTRIGNSYYILPVQYNEVSRRYSAYNADHWYKWSDTDKDGKFDSGEISGTMYSAAYGSDDLVVALGAKNNSTDKKGTARSWENRCAGCHQTGLTVESQVNTYGTGTAAEAVSGYVELNIGCEACHGPGADHVNNGGNPFYIKNPADLAELGSSGIRLANMVCGACHSRGEGKVTLSKMSLAFEYPSKKDEWGNIMFPLPGVNFVDNSTHSPYVTLDTNSGSSKAYFGFYPDAGNSDFKIYSAYVDWYSFNGYVFPKYIASKNHHQQWTDMEQGPHAPDKDYDTTCWGCHDPHQAKGDHQIKDSYTRDGVTIATSNDDNTLCLSCHAGYGPFAALTPADIQAGGTTVSGAVVDHIAEETLMAEADYDPAGSDGLGRCSKCHMPKTASSSGIKTSLYSGMTTTIKDGDIHNHTFNIIWPNVLSTNISVTAYNDKINGSDMANSCYTSNCHINNSTVTDPSYAYVPELAQWSASGHADFEAEPFRHWDGEEYIPSSCARCHSKSGYIDFAADGTVSDTARIGSVISCAVCHDKSKSTLRNPGAITADYSYVSSGVTYATVTYGYPDLEGSNICMGCHLGRQSGDSISDLQLTSSLTMTNISFINSHYLAAGGVVFTVTGYEFSGLSYTNVSYYEHDKIGSSEAADTGSNGPCIGCHMSSPDTHLFLPVTTDSTGTVTEITSTVCAVCHTGGFALTTDILNEEKKGLLNALEKIEDLLEGIGIYFFEAHPYFYNTSTFADTKTSCSENVGVKNWLNGGTTSCTGTYDPVTGGGCTCKGNKDGTAGGSFSIEQTGKNNMGAAFNLNLLKHDPGAYAHNRVYAKKLIYDSIDWLDDNNINGSVDLTGYDEAIAWYGSDATPARP